MAKIAEPSVNQNHMNIVYKPVSKNNVGDNSKSKENCVDTEEINISKPLVILEKCDNNETVIHSQPASVQNKSCTNHGNHEEPQEHSLVATPQTSHLEGFLTVPAVSRTQSIQETLCHGPVTCLAIFTTFCCNLVLGIPAFVLAVLAQSAQDGSVSRMYSRISLTLSVMGIVTGVVFFVVITIYVVVIR